MTTNITTLALNLLISERQSQRIIFSEKIGGLLANFTDTSIEEQELKSSFISAMTQCIENPNCAARNDFYQAAQIYTQRINGVSANVFLAA